MTSWFSTSPMFDEQAERTLAHALYGGADFGECMTTMQRVTPGDVDAWHREWLATADRVSAIADECAAAGHEVSAREAYLRASNYYRTSYVFLYGAPTKPELAAAFDRESAAFRAFSARCIPALQPVEIPYEGTTLPGYFCPASADSAPRPLLIGTNGYDSTVHEMYFAFAVAANRRGYDCLLFDGPGQGRALIKQGLVMRPDWENVVRPVVDFALARGFGDARRIALIGWSFGGYLALRAAGGEARLAACIADPGMTGLAEPMQRMFADLPPSALAEPLTADPALFAPYFERIMADPASRWKIFQRAFWVHGVSSLQQYLAISKDYTVRDVAPHIACPTFLAWEENDALAQSAPAVQKLIKASAHLARFTAAEGAGDHCAMRARSLFHQRAFDWLDETLAVR